MQDAFYETSNLFHINNDLSPISYHPCLLTRDDSLCFPHWHDMIELIMIQEGSLQFKFQNILFTGHEGDAVLINPNLIHSFRLCSEKSWYHCLNIQPSILENFSFSLDNISFFPMVRSQLVTQRYRRVLDAIERYSSKKSETRFLALQAETLNLLAMIIDNYSYKPSILPNDQNTVDFKVVKEIIFYIQAHLTEPLTLDEISMHVHFSKTYICRAFRKRLNTSIVHYINMTRCYHAHALLKETTYTIGECARFSGFSSMSYFSRLYQRYIGEHPSETRKRYKPS